MPKYVLKDGVARINSVDLSDHVRSFTTSKETPEVDVTSMGDDYQTFVRGIPDASMEVEFFQDHDAGEVDATLWPLSDTDTPFPVAIRPTSGAISASNPEFQMMALLYNYEPISGDVGSAVTTTVRFRNAGATGITRDTTP